MKNHYFTMLLLLATWQISRAQIADTLIVEPVNGDPVINMIELPTGADDAWVNYDQDMVEGYCVLNDATPFGWFTEIDLGFLDTSQTDNYAFTSCSYLDGGAQNHNWLILPPVIIPDSSYQLCWRSLISEGPAFMDGYKVVVSTNTNLPESGDFSNLLFRAAEMIKPIVPNVYTLNPADYIFSPGYIHANGFTDTNYYFFIPPSGPYRGRLEPHCVSLAEFAGQSIYIAFHHDSRDDSQLQLDDIIVSNDQSVAVRPSVEFLNFNIVPNPVLSTTYIQWALEKPEAGRLEIRDISGKLMLEKPFNAYEKGQLFLNLASFQAGVYYCTLQTASGRVTRKLVKI